VGAKHVEAVAGAVGRANGERHDRGRVPGEEVALPRLQVPLRALGEVLEAGGQQALARLVCPSAPATRGVRSHGGSPSAGTAGHSWAALPLLAQF